MLLSNHVSANLRFSDHEGRGLRTFSGIRRDVEAAAVNAFRSAFEAVTLFPARYARLTVNTEIYLAPQG